VAGRMPESDFSSTTRPRKACGNTGGGGCNSGDGRGIQEERHLLQRQTEEGWRASERDRDVEGRMQGRKDCTGGRNHRGIGMQKGDAHLVGHDRLEDTEARVAGKKAGHLRPKTKG
jgi:hypothetical protein